MLLLQFESSLDGLLDQVGRRFAIHAVLVLVGCLSWSAVVGSEFELVDGPVDTFVTVSLPQVGVEFHGFPEDELLGGGDLLGEGQALFAGQTMCFLSHGAWAISGVNGVDVPGHHDWWDPFLALGHLGISFGEFVRGEGGAELLDDALEGLGYSHVSYGVAGVHALLQAQHFSEEGVQWTAETLAVHHVPGFLVTDTDEGDATVVDLVVLLLEPVESTVTFVVLQCFPVLLATRLVLEELDGFTFALLISMLLVFVIGFFPLLDGFSQVLGRAGSVGFRGSLRTPCSCGGHGS